MDSWPRCLLTSSSTLTAEAAAQLASSSQRTHGDAKMTSASHQPGLNIRVTSGRHKQLQIDLEYAHTLL